MKKNILSLIAALILMLNLSYSQWMQQTPPIATYGTGALYSVFAISPTAVAAAGDSRVIVTCDGGTTWTDEPFLSGWYFYNIHTMDTTKWYSVSANVNWAVEPYNPCGNYTFLTNLDSITVDAIHFRTPQSATVAGKYGKIKVTNDGGTTWNWANSGTSFELLSVWYADSLVGVAVGKSGALTRTTDGGAHWTFNQNLNVFFNILGVQFPTPTTGYAVGALGTFIKTTDAGVTWNPVNVNTTAWLRGVYFLDSLNGYVVGDSGRIMKTMDGANTWSIMPSGTLHNLNSVNFINPDIGWIVGDDSIILKLDLTTGINKQANSINNITLSPNPSENTTTLSFDCNKSSLTSININDITGRTIQTIYENTLPSGHHTIPINVSTLARGIYFINIRNENGATVLKLLKE
jgi:photosystem II stability/assembly factor-like uncharacterized protein